MKIHRLLVVAALFLSAEAAAQEKQDKQDKEQDAERLFREGQKLLEERRYGEACPKFDAAYRKDHQLGTLLNLAYCHKAQGATWLAWLEFREAELRAIELKRNDRRDFAAKARAELEKTLGKVVVDNGAKVDLLEVAVEDRRVPEAERGAVFAVEPGERKFVFRAKGKKPATLLVHVVKSAQAQHVALPEMEDKGPDDVPPPPPPAIAKPAPAVTTSPQEDAKPAEDPGRTQRTFGWAAIGVGGAGLIVGTVAGIITVTSPCATNFQSPTSECTADVKQRHDTTGMIANVGFGVAVAGLVGGFVLVATAPSRKANEKHAHAEIVPELGAGWAGLRGRF